jgi:hypothetical protein
MGESNDPTDESKKRAREDDAAEGESAAKKEKVDAADES